MESPRRPTLKSHSKRTMKNRAFMERIYARDDTCSTILPTEYVPEKNCTEVDVVTLMNEYLKNDKEN